jgi:hypothetical protein
MMKKVRRELDKLLDTEMVLKVPAGDGKRGAVKEPDKWRVVPGTDWANAA